MHPWNYLEITEVGSDQKKGTFEKLPAHAYQPQKSMLNVMARLYGGRPSFLPTPNHRRISASNANVAATGLGIQNATLARFVPKKGTVSLYMT